MKSNFKKFKLKILAIIFVFTGLLSLSLGFRHTVEVKATTIPDGYAIDQKTDLPASPSLQPWG